jgi:hypothetical protein
VPNPQPGLDNAVLDQYPLTIAELGITQ